MELEWNGNEPDAKSKLNDNQLTFAKNTQRGGKSCLEPGGIIKKDAGCQCLEVREQPKNHARFVYTTNQ